MNLPRSSIHVFRISLSAAVLGILILAVTPLEYPVISGINDKLNHVLAFFALSLLADYSFPESRFNVRIVFSLIVYGIAIEVLQHFIPYRMFSLFDVTADVIGIALFRICRPLFKQYIEIDMNRS